MMMMTPGMFCVQCRTSGKKRLTAVINPGSIRCPREIIEFGSGYTDIGVRGTISKLTNVSFRP